MKKIKELQERSKLCEGRNYGVGFTILNKKGSKFETYLPFTACRDYLNDFAYVESTKKEIGQIYGYDHKLLNCFDKKNIVYFGVKTLHRNKEGNYDKFDECQSKLINNYIHLEIFLNKIETDLNIKIKTRIELDEDTLIINIPIDFLSSGATTPRKIENLKKSLAERFETRVIDSVIQSDKSSSIQSGIESIINEKILPNNYDLSLIFQNIGKQL